MSNIYKDGDYWKLKGNETMHEEDSQYKVENALPLLQGLTINSVLDVGCGSGKNLYLMHQNLTSKSLGIDVSSQAIAHATSTYRDENLTYRLLDVTELNEPFDLCMCFDVFEHVDDYIGFLKRLTNKAKYFLFYIPLDLSVRSILLKNYLGTRARYGHLHYFTRESALATLNYSGFEVLKEKYAHGIVHMMTTRRSLKPFLAFLPFYILRLLSERLAVTVIGGNSLIVLARPAGPSNTSSPIRIGARKMG